MKICPTCAQRYPDPQATCPSHPDERLLALEGDADDPLIGSTIDERFLICARIGQGGMGAVYRAWQRRVRREVAIKIVRPDRAGPVARERFIREAQVTAGLRSPHTITVFDFGELPDGTLYLVMELIGGQTLADLLGRGGRLPVARARRLALQACASLAEAHAQGLVHRDVKPANLMVEERAGQAEHLTLLDFGVVKLQDLGGARLTEEGAAVGSLRYMAPEQLDAVEVGPSADLYGLGATLYHLVAGVPPFKGDSALALMLAHRGSPPPRLTRLLGQTPALAALDAILRRCLAKQPSERFHSARALADALEALPAAQDAAIDLSSERPRPRARRASRVARASLVDPAQHPRVSTEAVHRRLTEERLDGRGRAGRACATEGGERRIGRVLRLTAVIIALLAALFIALDALL